MEQSPASVPIAFTRRSLAMRCSVMRLLPSALIDKGQATQLPDQASRKYSCSSTQRGDVMPLPPNHKRGVNVFMATSAAAVSVGLIATELVINALKHAFPPDSAACAIDVTYQSNDDDWKLTVSDNGVGAPDSQDPRAKAGLRTSIVNALAEQLRARIVTKTGPKGTAVSITHAHGLAPH